MSNTFVVLFNEKKQSEIFIISRNHASISVSEVICLPGMFTGLSVLIGGVVSMMIGGEDWVVVLPA